MRARLQLLGCLAAFLTMTSAATGLVAEQPSHVTQARQQLAQRLIRNAAFVFSQQEPTLETVEIAQLFTSEAVQLDPSSEHAWRMLLHLGELSEDTATIESALEAIASLNPNDDVIQLKRVNRYIESQQTVEDRVAAYSSLLSREYRSQLSNAAASRLALDLALLQRRAGNNDAFGQWLAEAVALDPSHRTAAAMAAGYFRANVEDPFAEGELLVTLLLADPMQIATHVTLGEHLLNYGAYHGAARMYQLAARVSEAVRMQPDPLHMADLALAQWATGDREAALRTIRDVQRQANAVLRRQLEEQQPELTSLQRARETAAIEPTLAVIRAAIHRRLRNEHADASLSEAVRSYEQRIEQAQGAEEPDADRLAQLRLELAWVLAWLDGDDAQRVQALLADIEQQHELSETVRQRFDGWLALRQDDPQRALNILEPIARQDAAAGLGHATALLSLGQQRDAARALLELARSQSGTAIGVWAADALWDLLGQQVSIATSTAKQLEELVSKVPDVVDRFPGDPSTAFSIRVWPAKTTFEPYEPVMVNVEIANNAPFPIAINADGPIGSQVALTITAEMVRQGRREQIPPIIVDINRRLRLMPRERLLIPVDLRDTAVGDLLDRSPIPGAIMRVRATTNFYVTPQGVINPGLMGSERETQPFRVDGFRVTVQWMQEALATIVDPQGSLDLATVAAMCRVAATSVADQPQDLRRFFSDARSALTERYEQLDGDTQAWMLSVVPRSEAFGSIRDMARQSDHRMVQLVYLLNHLSGTDDPMLAAAARSGDPVLSRISELIETRLRAANDRQRNVPLGQ